MCAALMMADALSSVISIETKSSGIHWREVGCSST